MTLVQNSTNGLFTGVESGFLSDPVACATGSAVSIFDDFSGANTFNLSGSLT